MEISWREVTRDDVPAWNRLLARVEELDKTGEHYDEADLAEELDDPASGPADRLGGWVRPSLDDTLDDTGDDTRDTMVAFAGVRPREALTDYWRIDAEGAVDPRHRGQGLGEHGVAWLLARATQLQAERHPDAETRVQVNGSLDDHDQVELLEDAGFVAVHWSALMRAHLDRPDTAQPREQRWPAGHHLERYDRGRTAATMDAHNAAFKDHWGFVPWTPTMWEQWVDGTKNSRFDLSWVLVPGDEPERVVAHLLTSEFTAYEQATGRREAYLAKIGVRRELRGRGVASTLLRHALAAYRADGFHETSLDVDTNNPTGAFGLYERAGYVVERRTATFQKVLPARGSG